MSAHGAPDACDACALAQGRSNAQWTKQHAPLPFLILHSTMPHALDGLANGDAEGLRGYIAASMSPRSDGEGEEWRDEDDEQEKKVGACQDLKRVIQFRDVCCVQQGLARARGVGVGGCSCALPMC